MKTASPRPIVLAVALLGCCTVALPARASCGSAFCSISTDWAAEAVGAVEGSYLDLRYEYIDQSQPRAGSSKVAVGQIPRHHDEVSTKNQNLIATYSRSFASGWGFSVVAPFVDRDHLHIHNHDGEQIPEQWQFRQPGDLRVTGRYQAALNGQEARPSTAGLTFGLKLPTGRTNIANSEGEVAERSLQPGTGTTDAILGAYYHQQLPERSASWFAELLYQRALNSYAGFAPGAQFGADVGYSQRLTDRFSGLVQLNAVVKASDRGPAAEPADSGSRSLFLSPGVGLEISGKWRAYAFYQQPLYQYVTGVQLTANRAIVVGLSVRF